MPEVIKYHNQIYYGASYHKDRETRGYLILKEDGIIPLKNEIMEIFFIALGISTIYDAFFRIAVGQMKRRYHLVKWANKVLKKLEQKYVKKSEELKHIQSYLKMTESTLQNQHKFKKFGLEQERLLFLVKNEGIITSDLYYKAQKLQSKMGRCLFFINYDQMQSYQDRKKAINFLIKKGDFFPALLLFLVHSQLHPPYVKEKNRKDFDFTRTRYLENKVPIEELQFLESSISKIRNPGLPGNLENPRNWIEGYYQKIGEQIKWDN